MRRRWILPALLVLSTLPATVPLLQDGFFSSSDGMIHLYRLFELDKSIHAGVFYPRWFPLSGYGYGLPVLNFYAPLSYYLAEFFHLFGAGYIASFKLLIASGFVLSALTMFVFARDHLGNSAAFVSGITYAYLPYLLSDAFIRGNFAEFFAMSLLPLALFSFRQLFTAHAKVYVIISAVTFAGIILTHQLTALLFAALLVAYLLFLFAQPREWKRLVTCGIAIILALMLSAFYWVPAVVELDQVYVGPASVARFLVSRLVSIADFFAPSFAYTYLPQSEALKHAAGFPQTVLALFAIVSIAFTLRTSLSGVEQSQLKQVEIRDWRLEAFFFFVVVVASIFMMLDFSTPLWFAIPPLRFLQFPWRFQILAGVGIAFLIGVWAWTLTQKIAWTKSVAVFFSSVLIVLGMSNLPVRVIPLADAKLNLLQSNDSDYVIAQMGWSWTREYLPVAVQESDSVYSPVSRSSPVDSVSSDAPKIQIVEEGLQSRALRVETNRSIEISQHSFFYPGWQAYVDSAPVHTFPRGSLGLVTAAVPSGEHTLAFRFEETLLRAIANAISLIAFIATLAWLAVLVRARFRKLFFVATALLAMLVFIHTRADAGIVQPTPADAILDQRLMLIGYSVNRGNYRAGEQIHSALFWFALQEMESDYTSFVHLVNANGEIVAQHDGPPDQGLSPTTRWQRGEIVTDRHTLLSSGIAPGEYRLIAGMYLPRENGWSNLPVTDRSGKRIGDEIELGRVKIAP